MRKSRKLIAILATLAMLATLLVPMVTPAAAGSTYSVSNVKTISPDAKASSQAIGSITVTVDSGSVTAAAYGSFVYLELPSDFKWMYNTGTKDAYGNYIFNDVAGNEANIFDVPLPASDYGFDKGDIIVASEASGNRLKLQINPAGSLNYLKPGVIILQNLGIYVPSGASDGPVAVKAIASSSSVFTAGSFDVAKIGAANVKVICSSPASFGPDGGFVKLYIQEASTGAMAVNDSSLKFTLPPGFKWNKTGAEVEIYWNAVSGVTNNDIISRLTVDTGNDSRTLIIDNDPKILSGSYFKLKVKIDVDDTTANLGDIEATVGGASAYDPSSLVVARYGDYGVTLSAEDAKDIKAGKYGEKIAKIVIAEQLKGSIIPNRTVSLTLPAGAKWASVPVYDSANSVNGGLDQLSFSAVSSDARTVKYTVHFPTGTTGTSDKAKLIFKDGKVVTAADFSGELKLKATGSLGLTNEIVVGNVKPAITASIAEKKDLRIGVASQAIADLQVVESAKEVFATKTKYMTVNSGGDGLVKQTNTTDDGYIVIEAPPGVTFAGMPTIELTEGNVRIDKSLGATLAADRSYVKIPVTSTSTKPSTVVIKNIKLTVDRTVPEGDLKLMIGGTALIDDLRDDSTSLLFEPERYAATVVVGNVITPASEEKHATVVFTINGTKYTVNGVEKEMDAAPYIKNSRTFIPVRYAAEACGVTHDNIMYADGKVTLIKGDKVVQLAIGSNVMLINGIAVNMDAAAEIAPPGRTMLPFRWVAQALGATVTWDEANQTVTMEL